MKKKKTRWPVVLLVVSVFLVAATVLFAAYDVEILKALEKIRSPELTAVMVAVTSIGEIYVGIPVILFAALFFQYWKNRKAVKKSGGYDVVWDAALVIALDLVLVLVLKLWTAKPRPYEVSGIETISTEQYSSFPSGHSSESFALFGVLGHYYGKIRVGLYALALLVSFSRLYLGVHYPTDVLAGAFIGIFLSQAVVRAKLGRRLRVLLENNLG